MAAKLTIGRILSASLAISLVVTKRLLELPVAPEWEDVPGVLPPTTPWDKCKVDGLNHEYKTYLVTDLISKLNGTMHSNKKRYRDAKSVKTKSKTYLQKAKCHKIYLIFRSTWCQKGGSGVAVEERLGRQKREDVCCGG
jgi:hypothetical protein